MNMGYILFIPEKPSLITMKETPKNPRIQHDFVLEITPFGNVKKACSVYYGRRKIQYPDLRIYPEQTQLKATVTLNEFIEKTGKF
jgi:hypothetical protein